MFDALALTGYLMIIYLLIEQEARSNLVYLLENVLLADRLVFIRGVVGLAALFTFVATFINIWQAIGLFLLITLLPIVLFNVQKS